MHAVPRYIVLEVFVEFWNVHKIQRNIYQQICETGFAAKNSSFWSQFFSFCNEIKNDDNHFLLPISSQITKNNGNFCFFAAKFKVPKMPKKLNAQK